MKHLATGVAVVSLLVLIPKGILSAPEGGAAPTFTWHPAPLAAGTALGPAQLNATADIPGVFTYSPAAGTVFDLGTLPILDWGRVQLSAQFTPDDTINYSPERIVAYLALYVSTPQSALAYDQRLAAGYGNVGMRAATWSAFDSMRNRVYTCRATIDPSVLTVIDALADQIVTQVTGICGSGTNNCPWTRRADVSIPSPVLFQRVNPSCASLTQQRWRFSKM